MTSKACLDHSFFQSCCNHIFYSQQFPFNSAFIYGRDLESMSRLRFFAFGVATYRTMSRPRSLKPQFCLSNFSLVTIAFVWPRLLFFRDLVSLSQRRLCILKSLSLVTDHKDVMTHLKPFPYRVIPTLSIRSRLKNC